MSLLDEPVFPSSWHCRDAGRWERDGASTTSEETAGCGIPATCRRRATVLLLRHNVAGLRHLSQGKRRANRAPDGANNYCFLSTAGACAGQQNLLHKMHGQYRPHSKPEGFKMAKQNTQPHSAPYRAALANWSTSKLGDKPTEAAFSVLHALGLRTGSKHALAMAMYMRTAGATDAQVRQAAHKMTPDVAHQGSLFNYMRDYVKVYKLFDRDMTVAKGVYKITLNARGQADVDRKAKAQADAAPVKAPVKRAAAKPRKPRAVKAAAPAKVLVEHDAGHVVLTASEVAQAVTDLATDAS